MSNSLSNGVSVGVRSLVSAACPDAASINGTSAAAILRRFGTDAHVYLPGIGTLNGLTAGNYLDSALTTAATVDNPVGGVVDAVGTINATQATTANKPILRQTSGKYSWQFDGSNDYLSLGSAPFQMADDHAVIASGTPTTSTTDCDVFGQRNGGSTNPLAPLLRFGADAKVKVLYRDDAGTLDNPIMTASYIAGTPYVVSCRKTGNTKVVRANGVDGSTKNTALGATTITTSTIGAGVTTGVLGLFNGSIGPVIAIKGTVTDAELLTLERFVSSLTPSGPVF